MKQWAQSFSACIKLLMQTAPLKTVSWKWLTCMNILLGQVWIKLVCLRASLTRGCEEQWFWMMKAWVVFYKVRSSKVFWVTFLVEFLLRNETGPVMHLSTGPLLVKAIEHLPCALAFFQLVKTFVNSPGHSSEYTIHLKSFPMHSMKKTWPNLSFFTSHSFPKLT